MSISKKNSSKKSRQSYRPVHRPDDKEQSRLFIEKAREIGADKQYSEADAIMRQLHKKPPEPQKKRTHR